MINGRALHFHVQGLPKSKGSLKSYGRGAMVEAVEGSADWRELVAWRAAQARRREEFDRIDRPEAAVVTATFVFTRRPRSTFFPTTRSTYDVDKLARNLLDALQDANVIEDDSQVVRLVTEKAWTDHEPGVSVSVTHLPAG